ncbi:PIN domain-containing protein [Psychrobacter vallis]|uniref:PIN domain-containing protein n=1 Tax=Psychrobacter vallis TaxID=248451 RepID=UPI00191A4303|nr:PIN domain-containing protein [Psychrobacter vallis]
MSHHYIDKSRHVLLDANLLTMYLVAQLGDGEVEKFKRTQEYKTADAKILDETLLGFKSIITTPQVLTETANLLDWFTGKKRQILFGYLSQFVITVDEKYLTAKQIILSPAFIKLGLSDAALFDICHLDKCVLLTADLDLYGFAAGHGIEAINFTHLRKYL